MPTKTAAMGLSSCAYYKYIFEERWDRQYPVCIKLVKGGCRYIALAFSSNFTNFLLKKLALYWICAPLCA